jgi:hypothetical protein
LCGLQEFTGTWFMDKPVAKHSLSLRERELGLRQPTNFPEEPKVIKIKRSILRR